MQRTKLLVIAAALVASATGATLLLGNASAATWHDYKGELYAGHAYGLQVPAKAESYEILLEGEPGATARLALFDPAGEKIGYRVLDASDPSIVVGSPAEGRHVLYVYDLAGGALRLRVDAPLAPLTADLQKMPLFREEIPLKAPEAAGPLDLKDKVTLAAVPAFVTLLYEGSAQGLDATVASSAGNIVTIADESGTAFSPGVWSSLSGTRASDPANIAGVVYDVTAKADRFEGSLVLVTLSIDHKAPVEAAEEATTTLPVNGEIKLPVGKPLAFTATKGEVTIGEVASVVNREHEHEDEYYSAGLALYAPDDSLLAYVEFSNYESNTTITLPEDGEYVAYLHHASSKQMALRLLGTATATSVRELTTASEEFVVDLSSGLGREGVPIELAHAPIEMRATLDKQAVGALGWIRVENANGNVASAQTLAKAPGMNLFDWSGQDPENFAKGAHEVKASGVMQGKLHIVSTYYLRQAAPALPPAPAPAAGPIADLL